MLKIFYKLNLNHIFPIQLYCCIKLIENGELAITNLLGYSCLWKSLRLYHEIHAELSTKVMVGSPVTQLTLIETVAYTHFRLFALFQLALVTPNFKFPQSVLPFFMNKLLLYYFSCTKCCQIKIYTVF